VRLQMLRVLRWVTPYTNRLHAADLYG